MTLFAAPAHAGTWQFTCGTGSSGQATLQITDFFGVHPTQTTKWVPPGGADQPPLPANSLTLPGVSSPTGTSDAAGNAVWTEDANVTAVITATWTHGTGQTDANDPAPSSVWLIETSSAGWQAEGMGGGTSVPGTGSASDGLSKPTDIPVISYDSNGLKNGESYNSKNAPVTTPPAHWFVQPVSGSTFTFTRTFTAHCVAKLPANATGGTINTSCGFGGYTVKVHAQPYNMVLSSYTDSSGVTHPGTDVDNVNGIITVHYSVSSTDGVLSDLASISAYETLDWGGNPAPPGAYPAGQYEPPCPPVQEFSNPIQLYAYNNPDKEVSPYLVQGYLMDRFSPPSTGFASPLPFPSTTWSATQNYLFDDPQTGEVGTKIPGPDNKSPFTIKRTVTPTNLAGTTGTYTITTHGATASESL